MDRLADPYMGRLRDYVRNHFPGCAASLFVPPDHLTYYTVTIEHVKTCVNASLLEQLVQLEPGRVLELEIVFPTVPFLGEGLTLVCTIRRSDVAPNTSLYPEYSSIDTNSIRLPYDRVKPILAEIATDSADEAFDLTRLESIMKRIHNCEETIGVFEIELSSNPQKMGYTITVTKVDRIKLSFLEFCFMTYNGILDNFRAVGDSSLDAKMEFDVSSISNTGAVAKYSLTRLPNVKTKEKRAIPEDARDKTGKRSRE